MDFLKMSLAKQKQTTVCNAAGKMGHQSQVSIQERMSNTAKGHDTPSRSITKFHTGTKCHHTKKKLPQHENTSKVYQINDGLEKYTNLVEIAQLKDGLEKYKNLVEITEIV